MQAELHIADWAEVRNNWIQRMTFLCYFYCITKLINENRKMIQIFSVKIVEYFAALLF